MEDFEKKYLDGMSIPEVHKATGIPRSTIRFKLQKLGILRSRSEAIRLAGVAGKLGGGLRGKKRVFSDEWRAKISAGKLAAGERNAAGLSVKPSGYVEHTRGEHKGRLEHVVLMEKSIGRKLLPHECVHHRDENRSNNDPSNLQLMTKSAHARHHALENINNRKRNDHGQFE